MTPFDVFNVNFEHISNFFQVFLCRLQTSTCFLQKKKLDFFYLLLLYRILIELHRKLNEAN